jgi:DNA-binding transcriptional MerR regulator
MQRGLVSEELRRGRRLYTPQEPEKLRTIMKKMRRQAMAAELKLDEILPELKAVQHELVETPQIIVKRGLEGIKNIFEDIASSPQSWYYFGAAKEFLARFTAEELKDIHLSFDQIRAKAGRPKILLMTDAGVYDVPGFRSKRPSNRDIKVVQREIKSKSALIVFHRGIAVLNFGAKPFGIIVRNQEIAEIVKLMFLQAWKSPNDK